MQMEAGKWISSDRESLPRWCWAALPGWWTRRPTSIPAPPPRLPRPPTHSNFPGKERRRCGWTCPLLHLLILLPLLPPPPPPARTFQEVSLKFPLILLLMEEGECRLLANTATLSALVTAPHETAGVMRAVRLRCADMRDCARASPVHRKTWPSRATGEEQRVGQFHESRPRLRPPRVLRLQMLWQSEVTLIIIFRMSRQSEVILIIGDVVCVYNRKTSLRS